VRKTIALYNYNIHTPSLVRSDIVNTETISHYLP